MDELSNIHDAELNILQDIVGIFNKYNLRYFLGFGTLLGAIRHHGFIPWDDDIDIFVPRPDFEKFKNIAESVIRDPYIVTGNVRSEDSNPHTFILRVEDTSVHFMTEKNGEKITNNVWVDLFPIDGMPSNKMMQKILFDRFRILFILLRISRSSTLGTSVVANRPIIERVGIKLNKLLKIGYLLKMRTIIDRFDSIRSKYPYEESEYVCPLTIDYMEKCICKREWFGNGKEVLFEDKKFIVPDNADYILKQLYGDYWKLPPEDQQVPKHRIIACSKQT